MRRSLDGRVWAVAAALAVISCSGAAPRAATDAEFDVVLRGGRVYDGGGDAPYDADVAITGDRIAAIGDLGLGRGRLELDVSGLAVAPGFINMLSWADETLLADPRSLSDMVALGQQAALAGLTSPEALGSFEVGSEAFLACPPERVLHDAAHALAQGFRLPLGIPSEILRQRDSPTYRLRRGPLVRG